MARLDAPRLAALVGAALVVALASSARPDESTRAVTPHARPLTATQASAPTPTPVVAAPTLAPTPAPVDAAPTPAPMAAAQLVGPTPATSTATAAEPPESATPESAPVIAPNPATTWTRLAAPRAFSVRGRHLALSDLAVENGRLVGRRTDGPLAARGPTLLVHYASWCLPCAAELPEVFTLARSLADISSIELSAKSNISKIKTSSQLARPSPRVVFVSHDEAAGPQALLASFEDLLAKARLTPADLPPGLSLRADPNNLFAAALTRARVPVPDPHALPSTWLLDRRGRLVAHLAGPLGAEHRATLLQELEALR